MYCANEFTFSQLFCNLILPDLLVALHISYDMSVLMFCASWELGLGTKY
jgi:hypothetical protein